MDFQCFACHNIFFRPDERGVVHFFFIVLLVSHHISKLFFCCLFLFIVWLKSWHADVSCGCGPSVSAPFHRLFLPVAVLLFFVSFCGICVARNRRCVALVVSLVTSLTIALVSFVCPVICVFHLLWFYGDDVDDNDDNYDGSEFSCGLFVVSLWPLSVVCA